MNQIRQLDFAHVNFFVCLGALKVNIVNDQYRKNSPPKAILLWNDPSNQFAKAVYGSSSKASAYSELQVKEGWQG